MSDEVLLTLARRAAWRRTAYRGAGLRVTVASAQLLLAMKVRAASRGDLSDIMFLAERLGLGSAHAVLTLAASVFGEPVPDRQRMVVEDLFEAGG